MKWGLGEVTGSVGGMQTDKEENLSKRMEAQR